jgi:N-acetylglucosaminylphosphatidylinositol deacetylase
MLGLRSPSDVFVMDSPLFPDSMTTSWSPAAVADVLSSGFTPTGLSQKPSAQTARNRSLNDAPLATIDILLTFDSRGVSGHPNHVSLFRGAHQWLSGLMADKSGWKCPVELYTLTSTNIVRKYVSMLDAPLTMLKGALGAAGQNNEKKDKGEMPSRLLFVNDLNQWMKGQKAMTKGHKSQMRWFRWGWILVGRYMVVNDLKREKIT